MSGIDLETEVRGAKELAREMAKARQSFITNERVIMHRATQILKSEMIKLVPRYDNEARDSIRKVVDTKDFGVGGRVGPGVSPDMPFHVLPLEGGRAVGARVQPFGVNSKLYQWVQFRTGGGLQDARFIAMAISRRGLPSKNNPRTPNPPPVFVERAWANKGDEVMSMYYDSDPVEVLFGVGNGVFK